MTGTHAVLVLIADIAFTEIRFFLGNGFAGQPRLTGRPVRLP